MSLVVEFDPVENWSVGGNISRVISYYVPKSADNRILPMDGFKGETKNADITTDPSRGFVRYVMGFKVLVVLRQELCEESNSASCHPSSKYLPKQLILILPSGGHYRYCPNHLD